VVTEGNYLLHPDWRAARSQLDQVWYLEAPDEAERVERLIARHVRFGKALERARTHVLTSDEANAALVAGHRGQADRVLRWPSWE
jgi:pantothenate kinase